MNALDFQGQIKTRLPASLTHVIITNILRQMVGAKSAQITPELIPIGPAVSLMTVTREAYSKRMGHVNRAHSIKGNRPMSNVGQTSAQIGKL